MTIGIDIRPLLDRYYSGVAEYTFQLLRELFRQDTENTYRLYCNAFRAQPDRLPAFNAANVEIVQTHYPNKLLNYGLFKYAHRPLVDRLLGADVFFMPHFNFVSLSPGCGKVITIHDVSFLRFPYFFAHRHNVWQRSIRLERLLRQFDHIIAVSNTTKRDLMELLHVPEKKITVIHSGIDPVFKPLGPQDPAVTRARGTYRLPERFMLYLGNLEPRKNIEGAIEAYTRFRIDQAHPALGSQTTAPVSLVIAGAQSWRYRSILQTAAASPYARDIHFLNYVNRDDKPALYSAAELFVFPSFYEGFGFPPLEAMACGTPVITSNVASLPEIAGPAAIAVNPHNIRDIAQAMGEIMSDNELCHDLRQQGQEWVRQYTWQRTAAAVLQLLKQHA